MQVARRNTHTLRKLMGCNLSVIGSTLAFEKSRYITCLWCACATVKTTTAGEFLGELKLLTRDKEYHPAHNHMTIWAIWTIWISVRLEHPHLFHGAKTVRFLGLLMTNTVQTGWVFASNQCLCYSTTTVYVENIIFTKLVTGASCYYRKEFRQSSHLAMKQMGHYSVSFYAASFLHTHLQYSNNVAQLVWSHNSYKVEAITSNLFCRHGTQRVICADSCITVKKYAHLLGSTY